MLAELTMAWVRKVLFWFRIKKAEVKQMRNNKENKAIFE